MKKLDGEVDYSEYCLGELRRLESTIDKRMYPKSYAKLQCEIARRGKSQLSDEHVEPNDGSASRKKLQSFINGRIKGFVIALAGVAFFLFKYRDGVYNVRRGHEATFEDRPVFLSIIVTLHMAIIVYGLCGLVFGSAFFKVFSREN